MIRYLLTAALLCAPLAAAAEPAGHMHSPDMMHAVPAEAGNAMPAVTPTEPGQAAFAAIQEIVSILEADPNTDWSKVDIDALRRHLVDMDNVTMRASAVAVPVENGVRFTVTGDGPVRESIRRMVAAHARTMDGRDGWRYAAHDIPQGAMLTVTASRPRDVAQIRGLGFFGIMAHGMHHQRHHLMIASGHSPHR